MYNMCEICLDSIGRTIPHNCQEEDEKQGLVGSQKDLSVLTGKLKGISV